MAWEEWAVWEAWIFNGCPCLGDVIDNKVNCHENVSNSLDYEHVICDNNHADIRDDNHADIRSRYSRFDEIPGEKTQC